MFLEPFEYPKCALCECQRNGSKSNNKNKTKLKHSVFCSDGLTYQKAKVLLISKWFIMVQ